MEDMPFGSWIQFHMNRASDVYLVKHLCLYEKKNMVSATYVPLFAVRVKLFLIKKSLAKQ